MMPPPINSIKALFARFRSGADGNAAIIFALVLLPILGIVGTAVDYSRASNVRSFLQNAADTAAIAALNKFETEDSVLLQLAKDTFNANLAQSHTSITSVPSIAQNGESVTVTANTSLHTIAMGILNVPSMQVAVTSTAVKAPRVGPVCVLALDPAAAGSISLDGGASMTATGCVVHANSRDEYALETNGSAVASADTFCAVGGYDGVGFTPWPTKNCSKAVDPYENLPAPTGLTCDHHSKQFNLGTHTASPGVYCNGFAAHAHAEITLAPGLYVIKDGPLSLLAHSTITGNGVTFYLIGEGAVLDIKSQSNVILTAPTTGDYAGLVFVQDASSSIGATSSVEGGGTIQIVGGIYLPTQTLDVGGEGTIGATSPYMPIIASNINFHGNASVSISVDAAAAGFLEVLPDVRAGSPRLIN